MRLVLFCAAVSVFVLLIAPFVLAEDANETPETAPPAWYYNWIQGSVKNSCGQYLQGGVVRVVSNISFYDLSANDGFFTFMPSGPNNTEFQFYVNGYSDLLATHRIVSYNLSVVGPLPSFSINLTIPMDCSNNTFADEDRDGIPDNFDACPGTMIPVWNGTEYPPPTDIYGCACYQKYCQRGPFCCRSDQTCVSDGNQGLAFCRDDSCYDGIRNQKEEGIDCGGPCNETCKCEPRNACIPEQAPKFCLENGTTINDYLACGCPPEFTYDSSLSTCTKTVIMKGQKCKTKSFKIVFSLFSNPKDVCWKSFGNDWINEYSYKKVYDTDAIKVILPVIGLFLPPEIFVVVSTFPLFTTLCLKTEDQGCVPVDTQCPDEISKSDLKRIADDIKKKYFIDTNLEKSDIKIEADSYFCTAVNITSDLSCKKIIENGPKEEKIDILFIGDGYVNDDVFIDAVKKITDYNNSGGSGLFSIDPFKTNKNRFNVWAVNGKDMIRHGILGRSSDGLRPLYGSVNLVAQACSYLKPDQIIVLSIPNYRSFAQPDIDYAACSVGGYIDQSDGRLVLHEFGHSFGKLNDEYHNYIEGYNSFPYTGLNCQKTRSGAEAEWGDLVGTGSGLGKIGYLNGCGDDCGDECYSLIRPTLYSIMSDLNVGDFFDVNKRILEEKIAEETGGVTVTGNYELR